MAASVRATNVIPIRRALGPRGARQHRKILLSPGAMKIIPHSRFKEARGVRKLETGSTALLVAASIAVALVIARFYLARSTPPAPVAGVQTSW